MKLCLLLAFLSFNLLVFGAEPTPLTKTIEELLAVVEKSDATFIRNGDSHTGKAAVDHMRRKYDSAKKKIKTPEDFIELCATKSSLSGKPYQIKLRDGKTIPSKDWLLARLQEIRQKSEAKE